MNKTPEEIQKEREEKARKALEENNNKQVDRRNAIADSLDEHRSEEMVDVDEAIKAKVEDEEEEIRESEVVEADTEEEDSDTKEIDGVTYYKIVVNGKEKWKTLDDLRNDVQKVDSADEYLRSAKEAVSTAVDLGNKETQEEDIDYETTLNAALMGDQEAVKKLAQSLKEAKAKPSRVTPDVLQAVDERMTFREAVSWFDAEYEEELKDPMLKKLIVEEDSRLAKENPSMAYKTRLKQAGDHVRSWASKLKSSDSKVDKATRKASAPSIPQAAGRQQVQTEEDAPESVESVIASMAKSRGTRAIKH